MSLISLATCARRLNDPTNERVYAEEACRHARLAEDDATLGLALANLGSAVAARERLRVLDEARELLESIGSYRQIARAYGNASYAAIVEDRPTEALELLAVAMSAADKLSDVGIPAYLCGNLGLAHLFLAPCPTRRRNSPKSWSWAASNLLVSVPRRRWPDSPPSQPQTDSINEPPPCRVQQRRSVTGVPLTA